MGQRPEQTWHQRYTQLANKHARRGSAACATWEIQGKSSGTPPTTPRAAEGAGPQECSVIAGRVQSGAATLGDSLAVCHHTEQTLAIRSSGRTPWHLPKGAETLQYTKMCTQTFTAALFIIAKTWKQPGCPSAADAEKAVVRPDNGMLSALKRDGLWSQGKTCRSLKHMSLHERGQLEKAAERVTPALWHSRRQ